MAGATSAPLVTALAMLITGDVAGPGVLAPEEAFEPTAFFEALRTHLPTGARPELRVTGAS